MSIWCGYVRKVRLPLWSFIFYFLTSPFCLLHVPPPSLFVSCAMSPLLFLSPRRLTTCLPLTANIINSIVMPPPPLHLSHLKLITMIGFLSHLTQFNVTSASKGGESLHGVVFHRSNSAFKIALTKWKQQKILILRNKWGSQFYFSMLYDLFCLFHLIPFYLRKSSKKEENYFGHITFLTSAEINSITV